MVGAGQGPRDWRCWSREEEHMPSAAPTSPTKNSCQVRQNTASVCGVSACVSVHACNFRSSEAGTCWVHEGLWL